MAQSKIQFPTSDENVSWFAEQAKTLGMTQSAFFEHMQDIYAHCQLADEHPEQASTIAAFDTLATQLRDLFAGMVVTVDTAKDAVRKEMADEIEKTRRSADAALAQVDELKSKVKAAEDSEEIAYSQLGTRTKDLERLQKRVSELEEQLSDLRVALDEERSRRKSVEELLEQTSVELKQSDASVGEIQRLTAELAAKDSVIARADSEIEHLRSQVEKLQGKLFGD